MMNDSLQKIIAQQEAMTQIITRTSLPDLTFLNHLGSIYDSIVPTCNLINSMNWAMPNISIAPNTEFYSTMTQFNKAYNFPIVDTFKRFHDIAQAFDFSNINRINNIYNDVNLGNVTRAQELLNNQLKTISLLRGYEDITIDDYSLNDILKTAKVEELEEQYEIIENTDSPIKDYLIKNHLTILSIILSIVFFVWTMLPDKQTNEQNEKIINLLEQQNQISIETLSEERQQTKLIEIQNQLLKELIADINTLTKVLKEDKKTPRY